MDINTEKLAYWYFRLNGFLGNDSYIIHRQLQSSDHATDIDYIGVRFMHRKELFENNDNWMKDDENSKLFQYYPKGKIFICLAEIKKSTPKINKTWTDESKNTLIQLLLSVGCISHKKIQKVVFSLQKKGFCNIYKNYITFIAIGDFNESSIVPYEKIPIISWKEILNFIYYRFKDYKIEKSNLKEWSNFGEIKKVKEKIFKCGSFEEFYDSINLIAEPVD
ncbi:MAG: hypothetical protein PWP52_179 [Bacteroidales bacterium]|nr:hypothetical protein [Bacteroidales bacterium]